MRLFRLQWQSYTALILLAPSRWLRAEKNSEFRTAHGTEAVAAVLTYLADLERKQLEQHLFEPDVSFVWHQSLACILVFMVRQKRIQVYANISSPSAHSSIKLAWSR